MTHVPSEEESPSRVDVCAVIYGRAPEPLVARARRAAARGQVAPAVILRAPDLPAAVRAAGASGHSWMWLLEAGTVPATEALDRLLATAAGQDPQPVLLAGKVLDTRGQLWIDGTLRHEVFEKEHSVHAAGHGLVQLRTAGHGSVLVSTPAWVRCGGPRQGLAPALTMFEWSARLLRRREDLGYLVPGAIAVRHIEAGAAADAWSRLRVLAGPAWNPTEKLWEGFLLGRALSAGVAARLRGGPGSAPPDAGHRAGRAG